MPLLDSTFKWFFWTYVFVLLLVILHFLHEKRWWPGSCGRRECGSSHFLSGASNFINAPELQSVVYIAGLIQRRWILIERCSIINQPMLKMSKILLKWKRYWYFNKLIPMKRFHFKHSNCATTLVIWFPVVGIKAI